MHLFKQLLSLIVTISMVLGMLPPLPIAASASELEPAGKTVYTQTFDAEILSVEELQVTETTEPSAVIELEDSSSSPQPVASAESGLTYTVNSDNTSVTITGYTGTETALVIPTQLDGYAVTVIDSYAFAESGLTSLTLPDGLTTIRRGILSSNIGVTELVIPASVTIMSHNYAGALAGSAITKLTFADGTTTIPSYAACNASQLATVVIPESVTSISASAFENCSALQNIDLPSALTFIGNSAFAGTGLTSLTLPDGLTTIHKYFLSRNTGVTELVIPTSVTTMSNNYAGSLDGSAVSKLTFSDGTTTIPSYAACNASRLTTVVIPESVTSISVSAFENCSALQNIELPSALTFIGNSAFAGTGLTSLTLPDGLTTIQKYILSRNTGVTELVIPASVTTMSNNYSGSLDGSAVSKLTFADGTAVIQPYAACNASQLTTVLLPESVTSIGNYAFANCPNLTGIAIPRSVTSISANAFNQPPSTILYCPQGSYASMYAIDNSIYFKPTGVFTDSEEYALSYGDNKYYGDVKAISADGYVSMTVSYAIKDVWKDRITDKVVQIVLPVNAELDEMTLKLDGAYYANFTYDGERTLKIPVEKDSGTIQFAIRMNAQKGLLSYAAMSMKKDGTAVKEIIGILNEEVNVLTLNAPETSSSEIIPVSGIAPASAQITLSVNGSQVKTVTASKAGNWSDTVTIASPENYHSYTVTASCMDNETAMEQTTAVVYREGEPTLTGFVMFYNEHNKIRQCDLMGSGNVKPKVYFVPGTQFDFEVTFDHPDQINTVYVTSTRNQEVKYLEAVYNAEKNAFVTDGYFDESNQNYVPGALSIEYTKKTDPVYVSEEFDWDMFEEQTSAMTDDTVTIVEDSESSIVSVIDLGTLYPELQDVSVETSFCIYNEETDGDLDEWLGNFKDLDNMPNTVVPGEDGKSYLIALDDSDPYAHIMLVKDISGELIIKFALEAMEESAGSPAKKVAIHNISSTLSGINTVIDVLYQKYEIEKDMQELRDEVMRTSYGTPAQKQLALEKVDELERNQVDFMMVTTILPILVGSIGASSVPLFGAAAAMTVAPVMMTAMIGALVAVAPIFWELRTAQIKGDSYRVNFVIDPSGYVYDTVTGERLEGVKTTAYCVLYDETEEFWNNKPAASEYGTKWNAAEYDQENPLYTNADGKYAWDVPEGWWRVKYEKDGYETTWSEWLPVPPPQTEVNIGMTPIGNEEHTHTWDGGTAIPGSDGKTHTCTSCGAVIVNPFHDVVRSDFFFESVLWAAEQNITAGYGNANTFAPNLDCTRGQVVTFLWRAAGEPEPASSRNPFRDVRTSDFYYKAVLWAVEKGITAGYGADDIFNPNGICTRGQVATFLHRYFGEPAATSSNPFTDIRAGEYYYKAVLWAVEESITAGYGSADIFNPNGNCTRGQIVTFLYRAMNNT